MALPFAVTSRWPALERSSLHLNGSPHTSESEAQTENTDTTAGKIVITAVMLPLLSSLVRKAKDVRWNNDGGDTLPPERHLTSLQDATSWAAQSPERLQHHGSPSNFPCGLRWSSGGPLVVWSSVV
ncbi:uncharacterized protein LOC135092494 [Scylla paramamosain]|uniref:uncharacterized protein LOC135092494 n=1 Tax=Scylla paramamosain TaxID=85552 RepID=UPI003082B691